MLRIAAPSSTRARPDCQCGLGRSACPRHAPPGQAARGSSGWRSSPRPCAPLPVPRAAPTSVAGRPDSRPWPAGPAPARRSTDIRRTVGKLHVQATQRRAVQFRQPALCPPARQVPRLRARAAARRRFGQRRHQRQQDDQRIAPHASMPSRAMRQRRQSQPSSTPTVSNEGTRAILTSFRVRPSASISAFNWYCTSRSSCGCAASPACTGAPWPAVRASVRRPSPGGALLEGGELLFGIGEALLELVLLCRKLVSASRCRRSTITNGRLNRPRERAR